MCSTSLITNQGALDLASQSSKEVLKDNIFSELLKDFMEVVMDDFSVYSDSYESCLHNFGRVLERCIEKNLVLNFEKCHFIAEQGIVLGHIVYARGRGR